MYDEVKRSVNILKEGGVILYPTDTIWGLGCDALNEEAVDKVYKLKNRSDKKSLIILLAEVRDIFKYTADPHPDIINILSSFSNPTTVIYNNALGLPSNLIHDDGSIGIRVTSDNFCKALIKRLGNPLVSTSANISGEQSPLSFQEINSSIKSSVEYIVNLRLNEVSTIPYSDIIKINDEGAWTYIRKSTNKI